MTPIVVAEVIVGEAMAVNVIKRRKEERESIFFIFLKVRERK